MHLVLMANMYKEQYWTVLCVTNLHDIVPRKNTCIKGKW